MKIFKLKFYVVVEKMALTIFGNPRFPDAKMRLDMPQDGCYREFYKVDISKLETAYLWIDTTLYG